MHQHKCAKKEDEEEESADLWLAFKYPYIEGSLSVRSHTNFQFKSVLLMIARFTKKNHQLRLNTPF